MATTLTRWDPFNELASMRSVMDRILTPRAPSFPTVRSNGDGPGVSTLGIDIYETASDFVVTAAVPGIDPKDLDISVEDEVLTIKGEHRKESDAGEGNYLRRELRTGSFQRALRLPPTVDAENATANFEHGVLKLTLPKKAEARARSIKITPAGVIDGAKDEGQA